ncbi:citrate synthase, partial [Patulibacter sp. NPDC049589]|uniref:citrate synthase n=1 Tax=Patulibacter sp. NPDC049589 TaxID=3154731 RepID=UPI00342CA876
MATTSTASLGGGDPGEGDEVAVAGPGDPDARAPGRDTLSVDETARRLGVKRETVYAYVSRGLLERHPASVRRGTRFHRDAVEALAGRARRTDRSPAVEAVVDTELTLLDPDGRLAYRGKDVVGLARHAGFERTAALLWDDRATGPWRADPAAVEVVRAVLAPLVGGGVRSDAAGGPRGGTAGDAARPAAGDGGPPDAGSRASSPAAAPADTAALLPVVVAALRAADPFRADRRPDAVRRAGRSVVAAFVDAAPRRGVPADERIAARLWCVLADGDEPPGPAQLGAIDAALVLLADHELAASTFAARVAASAWADPYGVVLTGMGPLGGALHGAASSDAERLLVAAAGPAGPARALAERLAAPEPPTAFGHRVYRD